MLNSNKLKSGNNIKFLCNCGQYKNRKEFKQNTKFTQTNGKVGIGFYYCDLKLGCYDMISMGNNKYFPNMGDVQCGFVSQLSKDYSYYVRSININKQKIRWYNKLGITDRENYYYYEQPQVYFNSIEEFQLFREVSGGLQPGDSFQMMYKNKDNCNKVLHLCWDGSKFIDYFNETEFVEPGDIL